MIVRLAFVGSACLILASQGASIAQEPKETSKESSKQESKVQWKKVLPESGLEGWEKTNFGGEGLVEIKDGVLVLMPGEPMTGVNKLGKDFPTEDFEMQWQAQRLDGSDFFVGITFPRQRALLADCRRLGWWIGRDQQHRRKRCERERDGQLPELQEWSMVRIQGPG